MVITVSCSSCATAFPVDPAKIPETGVKVRCSACAHVFRVERPAAEPEAPAELPELPEPTPPPSEARGDDALSIERDAFEEVAAAEEPTGDPKPDEVPDGGAEMPDWAAAGAEEWAGPAAEGEPLPEPEPEAAAIDPDLEAWAADAQPAPSTDEGTQRGAPEGTWPEPTAPEEPTAPDETTGPDESTEPTFEPELTEPLPEPEPLAEPEPADAVEPTAAEVQADSPVQADPPVQGFTFGKRDPMDKARRLARVLVSDMVMYNAERHQEALAQGTLTEDFEEEIDKSWKEFVDQVGGEIAEREGREYWRQALNDILAKGQSVF